MSSSLTEGTTPTLHSLVIGSLDEAYSEVMYIPSNLRCHDTGAGTLCARRVNHRFGDSADLSDTKWVYYQCSADSTHVTGYVDRPVTD